MRKRDTLVALTAILKEQLIGTNRYVDDDDIFSFPPVIVHFRRTISINTYLVYGIRQLDGFTASISSLHIQQSARFSLSSSF